MTKRWDKFYKVKPFPPGWLTIHMLRGCIRCEWRKLQWCERIHVILIAATILMVAGFGLAALLPGQEPPPHSSRTEARRPAPSEQTILNTERISQLDRRLTAMEEREERLHTEGRQAGQAERAGILAALAGVLATSIWQIVTNRQSMKAHGRHTKGGES
jgi:hypothetical protein